MRLPLATRTHPFVPATRAGSPAVTHAAAVEESLEDRVGARALRGEHSPQEQRDPWVEIADILLRLLPEPGNPARVETMEVARAAPAGDPPAVMPEQLAQPAPPGPAREPAASQAGRGAAPAPAPASASLDLPALPAAHSGTPLPPAQSRSGAPATVAGAPAPAPRSVIAAIPQEEGAGPGAHRRIVAQWSAGAAAAGEAMPHATLHLRGEAAGTLAVSAAAASQRQEQARQGLAADALATVATPPDLDMPPAAPPSDPVPGHTQIILVQSTLRLYDMPAPPLVPSLVRKFPDLPETAEAHVGGNLPALGEKPVAPDLFQVLTAPGALEIAAIPRDSKAQREGSGAQLEAERMEKAVAMLTGTAKPEQRQAAGERVQTPDTGPRPVPPLPPHLRAQQEGVGQVVARLLAQGEQMPRDALLTLRQEAFPDGVLAVQFPAIGAGLQPELATLIDGELREIATAAGVSDEQLAGMQADRRRELAASTAASATAAAALGKQAADSVAGQGQRTMDAIRGAADQAEEETLRRQEAASGGADPEAIRARRDRTIGWIREHVTTVTTHYQQAGERRSAELVQVRDAQGNAYRALAQREQYQVLTPQPPLRPERDPNDKKREGDLAKLVNEIRAWCDTTVAGVDGAIGIWLGQTAQLTRTHRDAVEQAGSAGIEAARAWAEDRELEGQSWWSRLVTRLRRWLAESRQLQEQWQVRRTAENRDAVARDLDAVEAARERLLEGLTADEVLADETLSEQQRAIIQQFFRSEPGLHPLEFAARRLRDSVALGHMERARTVFEQEMVLMPVTADEAGQDTAEKINEVVRAGAGDFDGARLAQQLHAAMDQMGTDEAQIYAALAGLTPLQAMVVRKLYYAMFASSLEEDLKSELSGDEERRALAALSGQHARADAIALHDAIAGPGTDEAAIMATLRNKSPAEVQAIEAEYLSRYGWTLREALEADLAKGNEIDQADALLRGDTADADAIALDEAMRGGITGLGTSEAEIEEVQQRVRTEVLQMARSRQWSSAQMEAEVKRRLGEIETKFGDRYQNVEQYNAPGVEGKTVLRRAFGSELGGAERDLANALQDNDLVAADAARIEIERTGFYSSDEKLRGVLQSQYERALEARRMDEGPAQRMQVDRLVQQLREQRDPRMSEEDISRRRIALERRLERELEARAKQDSSVTMDVMRQAYESGYNRVSLAFDMERMTGGADRLAARAMLKQGGRLDPLQEVEYAVVGDGTDEDALRRVFSRMTFAEIQQMRIDWRKRHTESLDERLMAELSGRDASDIMDMVENGAPESALEQIDAEDRRVHRELNDLTGVLGGVAAGSEARWMQRQRDKLLELQGPLRRVNWPDTEQGRHEREKLAGEVDFRVGRVREAVDDHRRRLDSYTDLATQIVGMSVGLVVAALLGLVSGGTLGMLTIALMASLMATAATMATKALIQGGAYGQEDMMVDAAVGVVDALATVATAGVGTRLLKPLKGFIARTRIGDLAGRLGRTGLARSVSRMPVIGAGAKRLGRAVGGRAGMERMAASFLAEGAEDAVSAVPSSMAQLALTDQTWRGDPAMNFLEGGGMAMLQGVLIGRAMAAGKGAVGHVFAAGRGRLRLGSEVGRLLEANRLLQEGFRTHLEDNPGASLGDFLSQAEGRRLRQDLKKRGLLPSLEGLAREARAMGPRAGETAAPARPGEAAGPPRTEAEVHAEVQARRAAELAAGVPKSLREGTTIHPDGKLAGNTVEVAPKRVNGKIVGVEVRAGPDATALDIALHAATIDAMQRYRGVLGSVRRVLEDTAAFLTGSGLYVGSRGWQARMELAKLSAVVASRMNTLTGTRIDADLALHLRMDVEYLQMQIAQHQHVLTDPKLRAEPGEGYVAAKGLEKPKPTLDPKKQAKPKPEPRPRQPRKDVKFNEVKQAQLEMELKTLRKERKSGNRAGVEEILQRIGEMTKASPLLLSHLTDGGIPKRRVRHELEVIGHALRNGKGDQPHVRQAIEKVRDLTRLDETSIRRLAQKPDSEPALAILLGVELTYHAPRTKAEGQSAPQPKAKPEGPPRPTARQSRNQAETRIAERTMRGRDQSSFAANTRDPGWQARMALAAFVGTGAGVRTFDEFLNSPAAAHLLGEGRPRTQAEHIALEQAYHQGLQAADRIRTAGRKLKIRNGIVESFFPLWAANHQRNVGDVLRAMEEWAVSGQTDQHRFPARMLDPQTLRLLGPQERQVSRTALPQKVEARPTETGGVRVEVESALLPGTLSRRELPGQPAAPSFNNDVRDELRERGVFKDKDPKASPEENKGKLEGKDWQVMHLIGPSSGIEGAMGMVLGPTSINTGLQTHAIRFKDKIIRLEGIEPFMNELARVTRAEGGDVWVKSTVETFGPGELPTDMKALGVTFFKSVTYEIHVSRPGQPDTILHVDITAETPPSTKAVVGKPKVIGEL